MESDALNAFTTGMNQKQYAITVTSALLARLDDAEVEAVLGHELTHIRNGDVRMLVIAVIIAGVVGFFAELIFRLWFYNGLGWSRSRSSSSEERGKGGNMVAILIAVGLIAVAWLLSIVIRFALSRSREFLADAGSVELTKNPDAMITALRKIEGRGELEGATSAVMEMCVDNPREGFGDLFDTHPPVDKRIAALIRFAGGHDPGPIALPAPGEAEPPPGGPWGAQTEPQTAPADPLGGVHGSVPQAAAPFLPQRPPVELGGGSAPDADGQDGPWGHKT
jgi:heat shock protein HtpX